SGRQSVSVLTAIASGMIAPLAVLGAAIGVAFVGIGKQTRAEARTRAHAERWCKAQLVEAGPTPRYELDGNINQAQFALNTALRKSIDQAILDSRDAVALAREESVAAAREAENASVKARSKLDLAAAIVRQCDRLGARFGEGNIDRRVE